MDTNKGMAFYRPTKHNSLFFISSNKSKKFQSTKLDQGKDGEEVTRLEEADHLIQVTFFKNAEIFKFFEKSRLKRSSVSHRLRNRWQMLTFD